MKTSAPAMASASDPLMPRGLVIAAISALTGCRLSRLGCSTPLESTTIRSRTPAACRIFAQAMPAAPAPATTTLRSIITRWITEAAFIRAASTTTAVPCWSSCMTGMSRASVSRCSTSKHRGAEMSSRLMAPNDGAIALTAATIPSGSVVSSTIGTESRPANAFISADLPSITGSAAFGPMSPRPSTAVPSEMTATTRDAQVYARAAAGSRAIRLDTPATPGVYSIDRSRRSAIGARSWMPSFPPRWAVSTSASVKAAGAAAERRCRECVVGVWFAPLAAGAADDGVAWSSLTPVWLTGRDVVTCG